MADQIDYDDPGRNMFGLRPCPKCGSKYRWPTRSDHPTDPNGILCDDCGHKELLDGRVRNKYDPRDVAMLGGDPSE